MSMSRKDYETTAEVIREARKELYERAAAGLLDDSPEDAAQAAIALVAGKLAYTFGKSNERFDADRFIDACKVSK